MADKKRRLSEDDDQNRKKIQRFTSDFNLIEFSDEILLKILKNLDSLSVWNLAKSCSRLERIAKDKTIWHEVDLTAKPLTGREISDIIFEDICCYSEIRSLHLRGMASLNPQEVWKNPTVCNRFLQKLCAECPKLESISIVEACFDVSRVIMICFPKTLRSFEVDKCALLNSNAPKYLRRREPSFFSGINIHMTHLERLAVENCSWFDTHDLIALSKLPNLKNLSLRGCNNLRECVPYGSIATRFGFKALEVLDVRNTPVSDSDIQCFNLTESLKEIRLQCPEIPDKPEEEEKVKNEPEPGPSTEPAPPQMERQTINVHFRRVDNNNGEAAAEEVPAENNENGAEFQAGNNVRINIRNQNVQGRNVIHILVRNNHTCNRDEPGPSGEPQPAEPAPAAPPQNEPPQDGPEPQHFIMIRGFQNQAQEEPDDVQNNPARLVQFIQFERTFPMNVRVQPETLITDRGICSFGYSGNRDGIVWIRREPENRKVNTSLERITVRDYKLVTDNSLIHLSICAPNIKFLDVVGTEITKDGIEKFKLIKPDCMVVSDFGSFE